MLCCYGDDVSSGWAGGLLLKKKFRLDEKFSIDLSDICKIQGYNPDAIKNHLLIPSVRQGFPVSEKGQ